MDKLKVLDIDIYSGSLDELVESLILQAQRELIETRLVSASSAHGLVYSKENSHFRKVLESFQINAPDGVPITWIGRIKGFKRITRCYGPDLFKRFMQESARTNITHFLCGGKDGVALKLKEECEAKFNNNQIAGIYSPPFASVEDFDYENIAGLIQNSKADVVWIGLSTPKQEQFAYLLAKFNPSKLIITVGAAFDFHIGAIRQAPGFIQAMGMEWIFRFLMEPKRLAKRYVKVVPSFIYYNLIELFKIKGN